MVKIKTEGRGWTEAVAAVIAGTAALSTLAFIGQSIGAMLFLVFVLLLVATIVAMSQRDYDKPIERPIFLGALGAYGLLTLYYFVQIFVHYREHHDFGLYLGLLSWVLGSFGLVLGGLSVRVLRVGPQSLKRVVLWIGFLAFLALSAPIFGIILGALDVTPLLRGVDLAISVVHGVILATYLGMVGLSLQLALMATPISFAVFGSSDVGKSQILGVVDPSKPPGWIPEGKTMTVTRKLIPHRGKNRYNLAQVPIDVAGDNPDQWSHVLMNVRLDALIFVLQRETDPAVIQARTDEINELADTMDRKSRFQKRLRTILVLINKSDTWPQGTEASQLVDPYREAFDRLAHDGRTWYYRKSCARNDADHSQVDVGDVIDHYFDSRI